MFYSSTPFPYNHHMNSPTPFDAESIERQTFQNVVHTGQDLSHKEFLNCLFEKCDLSNCHFIHTKFLDCKFTNCNLSNIKVDQAGFQGIEFDNCKLLGISFAKINTFLIKWCFKKCHIELSDFSRLELKNTNFIDCTIQECDFIGTNLSGSDFTRSDLRASRFQNTNLEKANFIGARGYYIDPTLNPVKQARFSYPDVLGLLEGFEIKVE